MLNNNDLLNLIDIEKVLHQLLLQIRTSTSSDAGTIYLKNGDCLKFCVFQNDSLSSIQIKQMEEDNKFLRLPLIDKRYIAVKSFLSLSTIRINDIQQKNDLFLDGIKDFDMKYGFTTHSMVTIPLVDIFSKNPIGILQIINKVKDKEFIPYSDMDLEFIKIASSFISFNISKAIEYKESLERIDNEINSVLNDENVKKLEEDRLNSFYNKILHTRKVLKDISHQWRQPLCEVSLNNSYLRSKVKSNNESAEILIDNQSIIQSLSSIIEDYETAYEHQHDISFRILDVLKVSLKLVNTYVKSYNIKVTKNIDKDVMIYGEKNIFIQVILSILQNSLDAFKIRRIYKPWIEISAKIIDEKVVITFEDNAGGIDEKLLSTIFELVKDSKTKLSNMTLNMLKIVIRDKFFGEISANNTEIGFLVKIEIDTNKALLGVTHG